MSYRVKITIGGRTYNISSNSRFNVRIGSKYTISYGNKNESNQGYNSVYNRTFNNESPARQSSTLPVLSQSRYDELNESFGNLYVKDKNVKFNLIK